MKTKHTKKKKKKEEDIERQAKSLNLVQIIWQDAKGFTKGLTLNRLAMLKMSNIKWINDVRIAVLTELTMVNETANDNTT